MAPPPGTLRVGRYFLALVALFAVLYGLVFLPGQRHTPKLGIDLVGGIRVVYTARTINGQTPSSDSMSQARSILADRVNSTGVTQSTVQIQSGDQLIVSIPGGTGQDVEKLGNAAKLNFRGVVAPATPVACTNKATKPGSSASNAPPTTHSQPSGTASAPGSPPPSSPSGAPSGAPSGSPGANDAGHRPLAARTTPAKADSSHKSSSTSSPESTPKSSSSAKTSPSTPVPSSGASTPPRCVADPFASFRKANPKVKIPTSDKAFEALAKAQQQAIVAALGTFDCDSANAEPDIDSHYYLACDDSGYVFLLGTVIVPGTQIDSAAAQAPGSNGSSTSAYWSVQLNLKSDGQTSWDNYTGDHNIQKLGSAGDNADPSQCSSATVPCADFVGFTLDGKVVSAPVNQEPINGLATQITGNFGQSEAKDLAKELNFGALPVSFKFDNSKAVSATLGTSSLHAAFLAGGIGLVLVILYSLLYYRGLGLVTIASLVVSGALTYAMLVILGKQIGFTLDLSGIAGFIVALGITADSFVVFFERIKDEVHDGRTLRVAVPRAWVRARRTILSADTVSFLAAAILYYFAAADVKGFAFTLGLSTILDLVVVFLFTHPIVSRLSRSVAFGSPRFTGLNAVREGGIAQYESRPAAGSRPAGKSRPQRGGTVVLEKKPETEPEVEDEDVTDAETDPAAAAEPTQPRKRTAPEPGTAAERAAARRARMRNKQDGKDER